MLRVRRLDGYSVPGRERGGRGEEVREQGSSGMERLIQPGFYGMSQRIADVLHGERARLEPDALIHFRRAELVFHVDRVYHNLRCMTTKVTKALIGLMAFSAWGMASANEYAVWSDGDPTIFS